METLTELEAGQELPVEVIKAWAGYTDISAHPKMRKVTSVGIDSFEFRNAVDKGNYGKAPKLAGFIEFYNKFYNLDNQPMKTRIEDWHNCVFYVNTPEQRNKIKELLLEIGFRSSASFKEVGYIRTNKNGTELSSGAAKDDWKGLLTNAREFEYEEAIAALLGTSPSAKQVRTNFDDCYVITSENNHDAVMAKLKSFGYRRYNNRSEAFNPNENSIAIQADKNILFNPTHYSGTRRTQVSVADILGKQSINTNNTPLNTKTDGNKIIVCKPVETITRGQRPEGTSISGKTRPTTIGVGHLSHRAINS